MKTWTKEVLGTGAALLAFYTVTPGASADSFPNTNQVHANASFMQNLAWRLQGNDAKYSVKNVQRSPYYDQLNGKKIIFLGSSITDGFRAYGEGTPDYLQAADGIQSYKYAVTGTTMGGSNPLTFVNRMKTEIPKDLKPDAMVVQLSTNDKTFNVPEGQISSSKNLADFNTKTTVGAMEYIIKYAQETWHVPVIFYTCFDPSEESYYQKQIETVKQLQQKWGIGLINLGQDPEVIQETIAHPEYMADSIHPTRAGYEQLWLPYFEKALAGYVQNGFIK
ncbi:SGNH/GDSL hydrolase family protein [Eupransor demetentiae]|uniref:Lysophospholipase L1 or related esterase. Includes spore coat protein LipC/YcsK (TesA) n=1 Tax=Eupransor demetentiae TaxID=3109584 RepID=A0ABM9N478_9LACO|nr:Lysophospholipase L1 or related esterase. Includes spore coat protein LipC/YcsK (TesA) [Lactobacillaceae bacterium LMG 33000]